MAVKGKRIFNDLGLGTRASSGKFRTLNKDGTFNVRKKNISFVHKLNFYHTLISMPWWKFIGMLILSYIGVNLIFGLIYFAIGVENLTGIEGLSSVDQFLEAVFFSTQTVTTLGYGRMAPMGHLASAVAAIESMLGLLAFALGTGLLYGRFAKPSAKIKYSSIAVVAPYHGITGFMFRLVNPQRNQLMEVEATVTLSMQQEGSHTRSFHFLELERSKVVFMPTSWTIVHPIDENSPLFEIDQKTLMERDAEFIVMLKAFDESFSQTVYSRTSYKPEEIKWGEKFAYIIEQEAGGIAVDISRLDETERMEMPG